MVTVNIFGLLVLTRVIAMKVSGRMILLQMKAHINIRMVISMLETGKMIKNILVMVKVY